MGEAKRRKTTAQDKRADHSSSIVAALRLAEQLIRRPEIRDNWVVTKIGNDSAKGVMPNFFKSAGGVDGAFFSLSAEEWVDGFAVAFENKQFGQLIDECITVSRKHWVSGHYGMVTENELQLPVDSPPVVALNAVNERLQTSQDDPRWIALALFCLARAIGVNARIGFESMEWTETTFAFFVLERSLLEGDGRTFARELMKLSKGLSVALSTLVGSKMFHGMGEAAHRNGHLSKFFDLRPIH